MHTSLLKIVSVTLLTAQLVYTLPDNGQFYGGLMSYALEKEADGNYTVAVEMITGWVLGRGPCGPGCSKSDIGRSTRLSRQQIAAYTPGYLGKFLLDYRSGDFTTEQDINAEFNRTYNGTVLDVSEDSKWEQELLRFRVHMPNQTERMDINFDGISWRDLTLQKGVAHWHMQTTVSVALRSDTRRPNQNPQSFIKPFYRVKLGQVTEIRIPVVDKDGDFIRCESAAYVEGGDISLRPAPNVYVSENCSVFINASEASRYTDDTWIAVAVSVRDYNRKKISYEGAPYIPGVFSLSASAAQFAVQVLEYLTTPEFVEPTPEGNHIFVLYSGTTWRAEIYAKSPTNTSIDRLSAIGLQGEKFQLSNLKQDRSRPGEKHAAITWNPTRNETGRHIVCVSATDNTGVESAEERCYVLDVLGEEFNHTTAVSVMKPYFVDIPAPDQFVRCKIQTTCIISLYIKSAVPLTKVRVTESFLDKYAFSQIELVTHEGEKMYKTDLSFEHLIHGKERICFIAVDTNGGNSDEVCIQTEIEPIDQCLSAPCKNGADCVSDEESGGFRCICRPKSSGKLCDIQDDLCKPNPCDQENSLMCIGLYGVLCYCNTGFTGDTCAENIDDCHNSACNGRGLCKDKVNAYKCECFGRYNGTKCEADICPSEPAGVMNCPADGCHSNTCNGRGVCSKGGLCSCSYGYRGHNCETKRCNISAGEGVKIISPSLTDRSMFVCYTEGEKIIPCQVRIYMFTHSGLVPKIDVNSTRISNDSITVGAVIKSSVIPGISSIYTTDIVINGKIDDSKSHYLCVSASVGSSESSVCYEPSFVPNPENNTANHAYRERNASVKFIDPTLKDRSTILCKTGEKCHILIYTTFSSSRHACRENRTKPSASRGLSGCDMDDKDNDEDDPDTAAKIRDPCCKNVLSTSAGVEVYYTHPRGPSCVTEASLTFTSPGGKEICFLSAAETDSQHLCYTVDVFDQQAGLCSNSTCLNNGQCFNTDHNSSKCICPDKYIGDKCQRGPCQQMDNHCSSNAYCQTNDGIATCICRAGFFGQTCSKGPSSLNKTYAEFTDTAKPILLPFVIYQQCSVALILTAQSGPTPTVSPGYVDSSLILESIETMNRLHVKNSFQTNLVVKPLELGLKDMCIQTKDMNRVNKDELCIKVNVISDVNTLYFFKDRPHFVEPSIPNDTEVECIAGQPCHIIYRATSGVGNEHTCMVFQLHPPAGFVNYHLFSSCDTCKPGDTGNGNCTVDVSLVTSLNEIGMDEQFCLYLGLEGLTVEGEYRCIRLKVIDPSSDGKKGCQTLECRNGGFCDGHIPAEPLCFCLKGFSGNNCEKGEMQTALYGFQKQSFIGNSAIPYQIECSAKQKCHIPVQIISKAGSTPRVTLGFVDAGIQISNLSVKPFGGSDTFFEGSAVGNTSKSGTFRVCFQLNLNSKTEDELCVRVHMAAADSEKETSRPYFIAPSISSGSTVLCEVNKTCHFNMHFSKGDAFGSPGKCPSLKQTGLNTVPRVHIFEPELHDTDCIVDVSYIPPLTKDNQKLCLQTALPGRKGETTCYFIKTVLNISEEVQSPCRGRTCNNGGECVTDLNSNPVKGTCVCPVGYSGATCSTVLNPCSPTPCIRGTCYQHSTQYHCLCPSGYTGKKCDININECISQPCLNGGTCVDSIGNFTCKCLPGFVGKICEIDVNECISQPCLNGGICKDSINQFLCQCHQGFDGDRCQNVVGPCASNPCTRGTCFYHGSQFLCECPTGFTGKLCETTIQLTLNGPKETYLKVPTGSELVMNCSISGLHPPVFHWSKVNACGTSYDNINASVYRQSHASLMDAGTYICNASDGHGSNVTSYFYVDIMLHKDEVCDFDDGTLCGWGQQQNDDFDWTFQNGPTQSSETGPDVDHTLGTVQGKYIYIESSSPRAFGEHASLLSHVLPGNRTMCFEFWYYMFGDGSGKLFVLLQDTCLKKETPLFKETGDQGAQWKKASVTITNESVPNDYRIVISADVGSTFHGDTAIDDLVIHDGPCQGSHGAPIVG